MRGWILPGEFYLIIINILTDGLCTSVISTPDFMRNLSEISSGHSVLV